MNKTHTVRAVTKEGNEALWRWLTQDSGQGGINPQDIWRHQRGKCKHFMSSTDILEISPFLLKPVIYSIWPVFASYV